MNTWFRFLIVTLLSVFLSVSVLAEEEAEKGVVSSGDQVTLNLNNADIRSLVTTVSKITGKNFIIDPRVKGNVNVISARPMSPDDLYKTFLSVLQTHGFTTVQQGPIIKIVPDNIASQMPLPITNSNEAEQRFGQDKMITEVVPLKFVSAQSLTAVLRQLMPAQAKLAVHGESNALLITDRAGNIARIKEILARVDKSESDEVEIIALKHASAASVVSVIQGLYSGSGSSSTGRTTNRRGRASSKGAAAIAGGGGSSLPKIVIDERTNSLIVSGEQKERVKIRALVAHLDTPKTQNGNVRVVALKHADAKTLAEMLQNMFSEQKAGDKNANPNLSQKIYADESTNSIVITGSGEFQQSVVEIIQQLDVRRAQVLVEAIIAEVSEDLSRELGVQSLFTNQEQTGGGGFAAGQDSFFSSVAGLASDSATTQATSAAGLLSGGGFNVLFGVDSGGSGLDIGFLLKAIKSDTDSNILATPSIMTLDNEEASIVVGQNIPITTGAYSSEASNAFTTTERQDVGIVLKVKPQISEGGTIKLDIQQEASSVAESAAATDDIITNKREIKTAVVVDDGQLLVLAGLIRDVMNKSNQRVPILGDIPIVGALFSSTSTSRQRQNLMVFLRPKIIASRMDADMVTASKYNYIRNRQLIENKKISKFRYGDFPQVVMPHLSVTTQAPTVLPETCPPDEDPITCESRRRVPVPEVYQVPEVGYQPEMTYESVTGNTEDYQYIDSNSHGFEPYQPPPASDYMYGLPETVPDYFTDPKAGYEPAGEYSVEQFLGN